MEKVQLIEFLTQAFATNTSAWLATIVKTQGHTYRKIGAKMVFTANGRAGILSGGCYEQEITTAGKKTGPHGKTFCFDMRLATDLIWGSGSGCDGAIWAFIEPVRQDTTPELLDALVGSKISNESTVSTLVFTSNYDEDVGQRVHLSSSKGILFNNNRANKLTDALLECAQATLAEQESSVKKIDVENHRIEVACEFRPKDSVLHIFGAGDDAQPLCEIATNIGFVVNIVDHRPAFCTTARFPKATQTILGRPPVSVERCEINDGDYVVIMTHNFEIDKNILCALGSSHLKYLGLLGPQARRLQLEQSAQVDLLEIAQQVRGPIGIDLGGEGPEAIALAAAAEIQKIKFTGQLNTPQPTKPNRYAEPRHASL